MNPPTRNPLLSHGNTKQPNYGAISPDSSATVGRFAGIDITATPTSVEAHPPASLAQIFHTDHEEKAAEFNEIRQPSLTQGGISPYSPSQHTSHTQHPSALAGCAVGQDEISGLAPTGQTQHAVGDVAPLSQEAREDVFLPTLWTPAYIKIAEELYTEKKLHASDPQLRDYYGETALLFRKMLQLEDLLITARTTGGADEVLLYQHAHFFYRQTIEERVLKRHPDGQERAEAFEKMAINFSKAAYCLEQIALCLKKEPPLIVDTPPSLSEAISGAHLPRSLERLQERIQNNSLLQDINDSIGGRTSLGVIRRNLSHFSFQEPESIKKYRQLIEDASKMDQTDQNIRAAIELQKSLLERTSHYIQEAANIFSLISDQNSTIDRAVALL